MLTTDIENMNKIQLSELVDETLNLELLQQDEYYKSLINKYENPSSNLEFTGSANSQ